MATKVRWAGVAGFAMDLSKSRSSSLSMRTKSSSSVAAPLTRRSKLKLPSLL